MVELHINDKITTGIWIFIAESNHISQQNTRGEGQMVGEKKTQQLKLKKKKMDAVNLWHGHSVWQCSDHAPEQYCLPLTEIYYKGVIYTDIILCTWPNLTDHEAKHNIFFLVFLSQLGAIESRFHTLLYSLMDLKIHSFNKKWGFCCCFHMIRIKSQDLAILL